MKYGHYFARPGDKKDSLLEEFLLYFQIALMKLRKP